MEHTAPPAFPNSDTHAARLRTFVRGFGVFASERARLLHVFARLAEERGLEGAERRSARAAFHGWVEVGVAGERLLATACDLSEGGIGLVLSAPHPAPGARVESEFALPGFGVPLVVSARVAWSDPSAGRLGLAFEPLDVAVGELLQSAVAGRFRAG